MGVIVTFEISVIPEAAEGFSQMGGETIEGTRTFPGFRELRIVRHKDAPCRFLFIEHWDSEQAYQDFIKWRTERGELDRGKELADHPRLKLATDVDVYFCDPQSPWQRGTNENTNRLLRQYFPKGTDLALYSQAERRRTATQRTPTKNARLPNTRRAFSSLCCRHPLNPPWEADKLTLLNDCDPAETCMTANVRSCVGRIPSIASGRWSVIEENQPS